jgi:hypothetical protein
MNAVVKQCADRVGIVTPYNQAIKEALKAVPTARWDKPHRAWTFQRTPAVMQALKATLDQCKLVIRGKVDLLQTDATPGAAGALALVKDPPPWPHQVDAAHEVMEYASYIHGGMGVGKTRSVVDAICNFDLKRVLVLCPSSVVRVWPDEFEKYAALPCQVMALHNGSVTKRTNRAKRQADVLDATDSPTPLVVVINYEAAYRKPFAQWALDRMWDLVVFDEAHRIKSPKGIISKFCAELRGSTKRATCMSGTPMPHGPLDVFAQYRALDPGIYGTSLTRFRIQYEATSHFVLTPDAKPDPKKLEVALENVEAIADVWNGERQGKNRFGTDLILAKNAKEIGWSDQEIVNLIVAYHRDRAKDQPPVYAFLIMVLQKCRGQQDDKIQVWKNLDDLRRKMDTITLRIDRDVLDLPPAVDATRDITLEPKERRAHDDLEDLLVTEIGEGKVTAKNALTRLLKLQQAVNGFVKTDDNKIVDIGNSRRLALEDILEDLRRDVDTETGEVMFEPVVIFCRFHHDLDSVGQASQNVTGMRAMELSGRINELAEWQQPGAPPVLAVQIQAGGVGVNLVRACYAIYYSIGFSLGDYEQAKARIHRPGQGRSVTHIHMIANGTFDEIVYRALKKKHDVVDYVLNVLGEKAAA